MRDERAELFSFVSNFLDLRSQPSGSVFIVSWCLWTDAIESINKNRATTDEESFLAALECHFRFVFFLKCAKKKAKHENDRDETGTHVESRVHFVVSVARRKIIRDWLILIVAVEKSYFLSPLWNQIRAPSLPSGEEEIRSIFGTSGHCLTRHMIS